MRRVQPVGAFPGAVDFLLHRWPTGVGIAVGALVAWDGLTAGVGLAAIVLVLAAAYLVFGAVRKHLRAPGVLMLEIAGVLGFGALALAALLVDRQVARYLLAAALFGHAVWDIAHHRADKVVPRPYAEFCAVFDVILAGALLALP